MLQGEMKSVRAAEAVLREAGFSISQKCCSRPSCFDFAAAKDDNRVLMKIQPETGSFSPTDSLELKAISKCVSAAAVLISERARDKRLEDDTVYSRYTLLTLTSKTFENIVLGKTPPLVQAGPGGCYVEIDGEAVKSRRQELRLSVGDMAKMVGISRRTLYGYERGMGKASVSTAYNLIYTLGIPVVKPVNVFARSKTQHRCCFLTKARRVFARNNLLNKIFRKFCRYPMTTVKKAPFDFVLKVPEEKMRIIGGVAGDREQELDTRVDEIISVSRVLQAHPVMITDGRNTPDKDILFLRNEEFSKIRDPWDLVL